MSSLRERNAQEGIHKSQEFWSRFNAISSLVQSVSATVAIVISLWVLNSDNIEREQSRLPYVVMSTSTNPPSYSVTNYGVGPAIVHEFYLFDRNGTKLFELPPPGIPVSNLDQERIGQQGRQIAEQMLHIEELKKIIGPLDENVQSVFFTSGFVLPPNVTFDIAKLGNMPDPLSFDNEKQLEISKWDQKFRYNHIYIYMIYSSISNKTCFVLNGETGLTKPCTADERKSLS